MAQWREEYLAALAVRDQREQANSTLYDACPSPTSLVYAPDLFVTDIFTPAADTRLADRTAKLATPIAPRASPDLGQRPSSLNEASRTVSTPLVNLSKKQPSRETGPSAADLLNTTRADLSEAQRSRSELQERLNRTNAEFEKLRKKSAQDSRRLNALDNERQQLQMRLKDRDEELRQKAKLLEVGLRYEDCLAKMASPSSDTNLGHSRTSKMK